MKEVIPRKYNEEEKNFISKYSESSFLIWETLSDSQKAEYFELEKLYADFFELYRDHYDDLKLYALMYRNVPLYNIGNDAFSILYFANKKKDIVGFKKRLTAKNSPKAQIVWLYSNNEALFPKVCKRLIQEDFLLCKILNVYWQLTLNTLKDYKEGKIPHVFSIDDLTEEQCGVIIQNKKNLTKEYPSVYNLDLHSTDFYPFKEYDFNKERIISDYLSLVFKEKSSFVISRINRYLILEHGYRALKKDIDRVKCHAVELLAPIVEIVAEKSDIIVSKSLELEPKRFFDTRDSLKSEIDIKQLGYESCFFKLSQRMYSLLEEIKSMIEAQHRKERAELEQLDYWEKVEERNLAFNLITPFPLRSNTHDERYKLEEEEFRKKSDDNYTNYRNWRIRTIEISKHAIAKIESLKNDIIAIQNKLSIIQKEIRDFVSNLESFEILSSNHIHVNAFVEKSYEKVYNLMWLYRPEEIKKMEAYTTRAGSYRELIEPSEYRFPCPAFRWGLNRKTKKMVLSFSNRSLMQRWCELIKEDNQKKEEQICKEQEKRAKKEEERRKQEEEKRRREEEARLERFRYNKRNRHRRDYYISFDETNHTYTVDGKVLQSVTNIVENCFPKFDAELHAKNTAAKIGVTPEEVMAMWERKGKESRELGTAMHQKIESYYQGKQPYEDDAFRLFKVFADKVKLEPYRTEWAVYDTDYNIAGTIDFVDYQDGKYTIYDWKRSDKIIANGMPVKVSKYQEKGLYPLEHLENCAYYHYALQLSLYKYILEKNYGIEVSDLRLGIFHPSYDKPYVLKMPYLENEVKTLMELRSEVIL